MTELASPRIDHVVLDSRLRELACRHCGHSQPVRLPISAAVLVAMTDAYLALHQGCPAPEVSP